MASILLGIETSCDETSLAFLDLPKGETLSHTPKLIDHQIFSHDKFLSKWGGVVPELSARYHAQKLPKLLEEMLSKHQLSSSSIKAIGVTTSPGLIGPLLTGLSFAKSLALLHQIPLMGVNHLFAHLEAIFLTEPTMKYPYLGGLFSGGHSLFVLVTAPDQWQLLGSTTDDAAGEALDKAGKLLGIPYPGGRVIDELSKQGNPKAFVFPRPMAAKSYGTKMSFSGLKNAFRLKVEELKLGPQDEKSQVHYDLLASYQHTIMQTIVDKMQIAHTHACHQLSCNADQLPVVFGGGVAANSLLRSLVHHWSKQSHAPSYFVAPEFCTDNGAMIAHWAWRNFSKFIPFPECLSLDAKSSLLNKKKDQWDEFKK